MLAAVKEVHDKQRNVGVTAALLVGGELVFSEALGYADLEHRVAATSETRFPIASLTKPFTGAALVKLHEEGRIDFDAPIQRYVPSFPEKDGGAITLRLLAGHLSGLRHPQAIRTPALYATHFEDVVAALELVKEDSLLAAPGSRFIYSSTNYNLLAAAVQAAAGTSFQDYVGATILRPLGLTATQFDDVRRLTPNRTRKYSYYDPWDFEESSEVLRVPDWDYSFNMGGGNMLSTSEDLVRFGAAFLGPGFFSAESLELFYTRLSSADTTSRWSYGWVVDTDEAGRRRLLMTGGNPGVQAGLVVYPDHEAAAAVLSNTWGIGARSREMLEVDDRLVAACLGWGSRETQ